MTTLFDMYKAECKEKEQRNRELESVHADLYEALDVLTKLERGDLVGAEFKKAMYAALRQSDAALAKARGEEPPR